jgi:hypothetical protein
MSDFNQGEDTYTKLDQQRLHVQPMKCSCVCFISHTRTRNLLHSFTRISFAIFTRNAFHQMLQPYFVQRSRSDNTAPKLLDGLLEELLAVMPLAVILV